MPRHPLSVSKATDGDVEGIVLSKANMERRYCPKHFLTPKSGAGKYKHRADIRTAQACCRNQLAMMAHLMLKIRGKAVNQAIFVYTGLGIQYRPSPGHRTISSNNKEHMFVSIPTSPGAQTRALRMPERVTRRVLPSSQGLHLSSMKMEVCIITYYCV